MLQKTSFIFILFYKKTITIKKKKTIENYKLLIGNLFKTMHEIHLKSIV